MPLLIRKCILYCCTFHVNLSLPSLYLILIALIRIPTPLPPINKRPWAND